MPRANKKDRPVSERVQINTGGLGVQENPRRDAVEYRMISMLERIDAFKDYGGFFEKLRKGNLDVPAFMQELTHEALMVLIESMRSGDEKIAFDAAKDVLDRGGYGKVQKVAVNGGIIVDHQTSRRELINMILTATKRVGLEVKDDEHVQGSLPSGPVIDVVASVSVPTTELGREAGRIDEVREQGEDDSRDDQDN